MPMPYPFDLLTVLGPTASGKTRLGVKLCHELNGEIISADSRQVYRGMNIGTGKDLEEYGEIPFHLIDIAAAGEEFSLFDFQRRCLEAIRSIRGRGRLPAMVGGTGLYLDAVLRRYRLVAVAADPRLRAELAPLPMEELIRRLLELKPAPHNTTDFRDREHLTRAIEIAAGEKQAAAPDLPDFPPVTPLILGIRWVPPAPGRMPRRTSGRLSWASGAATRRWQARASSSAPPITRPASPATTGLEHLSIRVQAC